MSMLNRRLQVLLDEDRYRRLEGVAKRRRVSVSTVVRDAIDRDLWSEADVQRAEAARRFLASPDMEVPDVPELLAELDELRGRRG
ncbi:MAG: antitoxin [Chloroflexi bacterium]|nr:antitoxin [Chloroflexota bacterium]